MLKKSSIVTSSAIGPTLYAAASSAFLASSSAAFLTASICAFSSAKSFSESILANSGTGAFTFVPATYPPNAQSVSKPQTSVLICSRIFFEVSGIKGSTRIPMKRIASISSYITVLSLGSVASSLANAQGVVSSMYLFARRARVITSSTASAILKASMCALIFSTALSAVASRSRSVSFLSAGPSTTPPKYLLTIATVLLTRLPRVFARSELYLSITVS